MARTVGQCRPLYMSASVKRREGLTTRAGSGWIIPVIQEMVNKTAQFVSNAAASLYAALLPDRRHRERHRDNAARLWHRPVPRWSSAGAGAVHQSAVVNAVGLPWAAGVGLVTTSVLIEFLVIANAITGIFTIDWSSRRRTAIQVGPAHRPCSPSVRRTGERPTHRGQPCGHLMHLVPARFPWP